jgi:hypothetical protein
MPEDAVRKPFAQPVMRDFFGGLPVWCVARVFDSHGKHQAGTIKRQSSICEQQLFLTSSLPGSLSWFVGVESCATKSCVTKI